MKSVASFEPESRALLWPSIHLPPAAPATLRVNIMKSLFVGLVVAITALSVSAGDARNTEMSQQAVSLMPMIPMCPPGEVAKLVKVNGVYEWECVLSN
jgi:hypothetical protein